MNINVFLHIGCEYDKVFSISEYLFRADILCVIFPYE
eukprot:UN01806